MIFVVIYKYLNCAVAKTIGTSDTTSTDCNINYRIILLMMLFTTSLHKPLKTARSRNIYIPLPLEWSLICQLHTVINVYVSATAQSENV